MCARFTPGPSKPSPIYNCFSVDTLMSDPVKGWVDERIVLFEMADHESMFFDPGYETDSTPGLSWAHRCVCNGFDVKVRVFGTCGENGQKAA
jgi:hypothetical protein